MQFHFDIVIMLNEQPLGFDNDYKVKQKDVDRLNDLARYVTMENRSQGLTTPFQESCCQPR